MPAVERRGPGDLGATGVIGRPAAAVHVCVDETRHHDSVGEVEIGGFRGCTGSALGDPNTGGAQPAGSADPPVENDRGGAEQGHTGSVTPWLLGTSVSGHLPPFSQKCRMSSSCRPLVSGAYR